MVNINELYPGCKVRIADRWVSGCHQARRWRDGPLAGQRYDGARDLTKRICHHGGGCRIRSDFPGWTLALVSSGYAEVLVDVPPIDDLI